MTASPSDEVLIDVDLRHVIFALSDALDLVGVDDVGHGKRVGIMAAGCGRALGRSGDEQERLFDLGLLHDIGVSSTRVHAHLVAEFDWEGSQDHCATGAALLRGFAPLSSLAAPVLHHHTRWEKLACMPGVTPQEAEQANLIYLVDRVDAQAAPYYATGGILMQATALRESIAERSGTYFAPALVDAFLAASACEAFWLQLEPRGIAAILLERQAQGRRCAATMAELKQLATIFSRIVDAKSPFTAQHSLGVARLARLLAQRMGLDAERCDRLEIAALLHDLGKLRVPDEVLEKPGPLDDRERKLINAHSFETYQILRPIRGFEDIARWAAYHHEEPDGNGYPFHVTRAALPLEARLLRVADIFQAMAQDRPYREGMNGEAILAFLRTLAGQGRVDGDIVEIAGASIQEAMTAARPVAAARPVGHAPDRK
ncbi:HD-GYP domain-containing protein [Paludibacterium yongneupense]|uniref:HD-GYP domain-containing protein n=1 Tax=Paludibacterium yongneupense TaxID=400061 RepID=UPI0012EC4C65|nr:HD domain-containing phosphohydrolase [Paludibacterium yongneupense]